MTIALFALPLALVALAGYGWSRGGRELRIGLSVLAGTLAICAVLSAVALRLHRHASAQWVEFSIGPASGESLTVNTTMMRSNGITLKSALATAYDIPAVRVIGPSWLTNTRYSINAVVSLDASDTFRSLLQEELNNRLHLDTHLEVRPFDVFVLTATDAPRLERSDGNNSRLWVHQRDTQMRDASMDTLASALQAILGKPVVDETGITGSYNLEFGWEEDRVASVTATLRDRFGLRLSPGKRDLEALVVDDIRRDGALLLLAEIGRLTRRAPPQFRQRIADVLRID